MLSASLRRRGSDNGTATSGAGEYNELISPGAASSSEEEGDIETGRLPNGYTQVIPPSSSVPQPVSGGEIELQEIPLRPGSANPKPGSAK